MSSKNSEKTVATVKPVRGERRIQVKKNDPGYKSKIVPFDDIDKIQFKVKSAAQKDSTKNPDMKYWNISLLGKMPDESDREYREIEFRLPKRCVSPIGVSLKYGYALGVFFDMKDPVWKAHKEKLIGMRANIAKALLEKYDEIAADCGMDAEATEEEHMLREINNKLSKLVKPAKPKNGAKANLEKQYMNLDCRYTKFMYEVIHNGQRTNTVDKIAMEDLVDMKVVHNTKVKIGNLRGITSAIGISLIARDSVIRSLEAIVEEVDIAEELNDGHDVVDVAAQLEKLKEDQKSIATDEDAMIKSMIASGSLGSGVEGEPDYDLDDDDDDDVTDPMA